MATNYILPFAGTDTGTNLLTQDEYEADAQRIIGHQPGVARSKLENKALRQATAMASGLAQFIADGQADDVTDAKTPAEIAAMLLAANTAQMPAASQTDAGKIRIATAAEAAAFTDATAAITPANLLSAFANNAAVDQYGNGRFRLPNGYIVQFGFKAAGVEYSDTVTYPIAYPNEVFIALATPYSNPSSTEFFSVAINWRTNTQLSVLKYITANGGSVRYSTGGWHWLTIGN